MLGGIGPCVLAAALLTYAGACGGPSNLNYAYEKEPDPRRGGYAVGPLDVLRVNVWKDPDLSGDVQVRPDGKITMPLVGFTVSGNVTNPGRYASGTYVTVLEALALAGEPTPYASPQHITILRSDRAGKLRKIPVNYDALVTTEHLRQNVPIMRGDVIVVP